MKRYKKANEGIHAPEETKEITIRPAGKRTYRRWMGAVAAVLAVAIIGGIAAWSGRAYQPAAQSNDPGGGPGVGRSAPGNGNPDLSQNATAPDALTTHALAMAAGYDLPPEPKYEDFRSEDGSMDYDAYWAAVEPWRDIINGLQNRLDEVKSIDKFAATSTTQFLAGAGTDNRVYSPLNLYMALAMLAETAGGESRQQVLDVLGADSIEALREDAATVWQNYYQDDDMGVSVMANSLWLRDDMSYSQDTLDTLAQKYYASSFAGEMGSAEYDQVLRDWVNKQTRGVLTEQADGLSFDPRTVLGLVSTLYFKSAWSAPFNPELNTREAFHSPSGDVETEFLHTGEWHDGTYYWGDHFSATGLGFQSSMGYGADYGMWLILPDEGYTVDDLIASGEALEFLLTDKGVYVINDDYDTETQWPDQKHLMINLSLPKFDVSSNLDLSDGLKALGITDVFNPAVSNFDPLGASTSDPLYVSKAEHAARVMIDEEGCTAASYVDLMLCGAGMPPDEKVDFTLDRPFLFAITGNSDLPLFLGVVNQPNG